MSGVLVDSNVILDVYTDDARWADWSESVLNQYRTSHTLYINPVIYAEISIGFDRIEDLESSIMLSDFKFLHIPKEALFLAGKAFLQYRRRQGNKSCERYEKSGGNRCFENPDDKWLDEDATRSAFPSVVTPSQVSVTPRVFPSSDNSCLQ